jgi:uncharacterized protein YuzE
MTHWYDKDTDILNIQLGTKKYWKSVELPHGVIIDIARDGTIIGIEIFRASRLFTGEDGIVLGNVASPQAQTIA